MAGTTGDNNDSRNDNNKNDVADNKPWRRGTDDGDDDDRKTRIVKARLMAGLLLATGLAHGASREPEPGEDGAAWRQGAQAYWQLTAAARRRALPLLVFLPGGDCRRDAAGCAAVPALTTPGFRRLHSRTYAVRLDPCHGPAARRLARRYTGGRADGRPRLFAELPGSGLQPAAVGALEPGAAGRVLTRLYRASAARLVAAGALRPAERARRQARALQRLY